MADKKKLVEKREEEEIRKVEEEPHKRQEEIPKAGMEVGSGPSGVTRTPSVSSFAESESEAEGRKRPREDRDGSDKIKKKRTELDDDFESEDFGEDPLQNVESGLDLVLKWLRQPTIQKMVTKPQQKKLEKIVERVRAEAIRGREERIRKEAREEERGVIAEMVRDTIKEELAKRKPEQPVGAKTYASALGKSVVPKVTGVRGPVQPAPKVVFVRHDKKESQEVIATLKKLVKPSELGIKVKRLTSIKNGVIVEAESEEGAEILMNQRALAEAGLKVGKPVRKKPVVMVYDVGSDLKDEEVRREVFTRNMEGSEISEAELKEEFVVRHRYKDAKSSGKKCHLVVECSVRVRNWLRGKERVFIEWQSCRVKDYVDVARCYRCQKYGHIAKHCSSEKPGCSFCAEEHEFKECPNKDRRDKARCANCKRDGRANLNHDAGWRGCPSYERAAKRNSDRIDYGL